MNKILSISAILLAAFIIFLIVDSQLKEPIVINKLIKTIYPDWNPQRKKGEADKPQPADIAAENNAQQAPVVVAPAEIPVTGGRTPLMDAVLKAKDDDIKKLIFSGADINKQDGMGNTAVNLAVFLGREDAVNTLLVNGANPNIPDSDGMTPTAKAARMKQYKIAKMLLERGANPNLKNNEGQTPLMLAGKYGYEDITDLLIKNSAKVNEKDNLGRTALIEAASNGYTRVVVALLSMGADKNIRDNQGQTAQDYAFRFGHEDIAVLLQDDAASTGTVVGEPVEPQQNVTPNGAVIPPAPQPDRPPVSNLQ